MFSNITASPADGLYIFQFKRYSRAWALYHDFTDRRLQLKRKLLNPGFLKERWKSSLRNFFGRHHDLVDQYEVHFTRQTPRREVHGGQGILTLRVHLISLLFCIGARRSHWNCPMWKVTVCLHVLSKIKSFFLPLYFVVGHTVRWKMLRVPYLYDKQMTTFDLKLIHNMFKEM